MAFLPDRGLKRPVTVYDTPASARVIQTHDAQQPVRERPQFFRAVAAHQSDGFDMTRARDRVHSRLTKRQNSRTIALVDFAINVSCLQGESYQFKRRAFRRNAGREKR